MSHIFRLGKTPENRNIGAFFDNGAQNTATVIENTRKVHSSSIFSGTF